MSKLGRPGQAGTMESNDITITVAPNDADGIDIELNSPVSKQYGSQIRTAIIDELNAQGVTTAKVVANDKGAIDCTIRARVRTAVARALD